MRYPLLLCFLLMSSFAFSQAAGKPNIILIISDDFNDFIEPLQANANAETPNINLIAANGTLFTNAYAPSPLCAPCRTSFLTGKDPFYTQVYANDAYRCYRFKNNFTVAQDNAQYFTLPGYLKDSGGYFTYNINKIFHCHENYVEFDSLTANACEKTMAWNRYFVYNEGAIIDPVTATFNEGIGGYAFGRLNDTLEKYMTDYVAVDSAISFINQLAADNNKICEKPFFLALGLDKPHKNQYVPEKYFLDDYNPNFIDPFNIPYNYPKNTSPPNGIILPPQPAIPFADLDSLPENGMAWRMIGAKDTEFINWATDDLYPLPIIDAGLTDSARLDIVAWSKKANAIMAYLAAVKFVDAQVGRLYTELLHHPEILNNTIVIFMGDHGYALGEKRHWEKYALWETDVRTSLVIADFRNPVDQNCTRTVSLNDLFPTLCDYAEVAYPTFADGSDYVDGKSLLPLMNTPTLKWERPVLSSTKRLVTQEGHCYPQYSVRNGRFHYILYKSNGGGDLVCNAGSSYIEEELYEIGENRETDPNEWNNLINNPEYASEVHYLQQFLPDSALYLQKAFSADILQTGTLPCLLKNNQKIKLQGKLYDSEGVLISGSGYTFKWTNSLTGAIHIGKTYTFMMATIPAAIFAANNHIILYLTVTETATGKLVAFNSRTYYINTATTPNATFSLLMDIPTLKASIVDYAITGTYTNTSWDFGDGYSTEEFSPGPHYYAMPSIYPIYNYIQYGNGCTKSISHPANLLRASTSQSDIILYPNPAVSRLNIACDTLFDNTEIKILNMEGQLVISQYMGELDGHFQIDISWLPAGSYILQLQASEEKREIVFEIAR